MLGMFMCSLMGFGSRIKCHVSKLNNLLINEDSGQVTCVASVSVGLGSRERARNGILRETGARAKIRKRSSSLPLNPTEMLATQASGQSS